MNLFITIRFHSPLFNVNLQWTPSLWLLLCCLLYKDIKPKIYYLNLTSVSNLCWYKREQGHQLREGTSALPSSTVAWSVIE